MCTHVMYIAQYFHYFLLYLISNDFCLTLIGVFAVIILPLHDSHTPRGSNETVTNISASISFSVALNRPASSTHVPYIVCLYVMCVYVCVCPQCIKC